MRSLLKIIVLLGLGLGLGATAWAETLLMARSPQNFPEAMLSLQGTIVEHGYTVSRVQRVDIGLTSSGFATDKYRIVFFGKPAEVRELSRRYPELIPYLPLKLTIFAEKEETLIVTANPEIFRAMVPDPRFAPVIDRWSRDIQSMMESLREEH